jgi:thioredoxin reductase (NADPH)
LIVGAGPSGLFQAFQLGLLGIHATLVDTLARIGGQCSALYADKPIYDIPGIVRINGAELGDRLWAQCSAFDPELLLATAVESIEGDVERGFEVGLSNGGRRVFGAVVVAGGVGAFAPRRLRIEEAERWEDQQLCYGLPASWLCELAGRHLVVSGAGERGLAALAQVLELPEPCAPAAISLVHRSPTVQASEVQWKAMRCAIEAGRLSFHHGTIVALHARDANAEQLAALSVRLRALESPGEVIRVAADRLVVCHGLSPRLAPLLYAEMGLRHGQIPVDASRMESARKGIFVVGDLGVYPGKQKLLVCGFHEAVLAAYAACDYLFPGKKIHLQYTTTSPRLRAKLDAFHAE